MTNYYQSPHGTEAIEVIRDFFDDNFYRANVFKYIVRAGRKPGVPAEVDLRKAISYLEYELDNLTGTGVND